MGPRDAHIWNDYVHRHPNRFHAIVYDMRVGPVEHVPDRYPQNIKEAWIDLCRGRIDVVAEDKDNIYIIEVKPRARGEALGQALHNAHLYSKENPTSKPVIPAIVTDVVLPGTKIVAEHQNVMIFTP